MIKGKFVGKVSISFEYPNDEPDLLPYEEMKEKWERLQEFIKQVLENECGESFSVTVETLENNLIKTEI